MPSPPRRATRSGIPSAGSASASGSRSQNSNSSASSVSSNRVRGSSNGVKVSPPAPSASPPASEADDQDGAAANSRRSKRTRKPQEEDEVHDQIEAQIEVADGDDSTVRCVCGSVDPPLNQSAVERDSYPDALYICCDKCSVWQHGGCVGLFEDEMMPENYYCELCDPKAHQLSVDNKGWQYSRYLPLAAVARPPQRKASLTKEPTESRPKKERDSSARASTESASASARRRATMNSSRIGYDEEEELRKAIERSKVENEKAAGNRKGKRGRDDSDATSENKRQRLGSGSEDATPSHNTASQHAGSDDEESLARNGQKKANKVFATDAQRQKEARERERTKEQQRLDAASRRKDRAGRRRFDDVEAAEGQDKGTPELATGTQSPPTIELAPPSSPPNGKKGGTRGKTKRTGKESASPPTNSTGAPDERDQSTAAVEGEDTAIAASSAKAKGKWKGKGSKQTTAGDSDSGKEKAERSIQEMENVTQWMLSFMAKQKEAHDAQQTAAFVKRNTVDSSAAPPVAVAVADGEDEEFAQLSSDDMAARLRNQIMSWRSEFTGSRGADTAAAAGTESVGASAGQQGLGVSV